MSELISVSVDFENDISSLDSGVLEAFGVQGRFNDHIEAKFPDDYEIMLITGESGSGKSSILKKMSHGFRAPEVPEEVPLLDIFGDMGMLSKFGLGDPKIFGLPVSALSEGQRCRAMYAYAFMKSDGELFFDEFLANLDRETAKCIAWNLHKICKRTGRRMVVATSNPDFQDFLRPDVVLEMNAFPRGSCFIRNDYGDDNPILDDVEIHEGDKSEYRESRLAELHYRGKYSGGRQRYFFATSHGRQIGLLVTVKQRSGGNRISRVVVHPSYRGCGVATLLVRTAMESIPGVDVAGSFVPYTRCFENAGMIRVHDMVEGIPDLGDRLSAFGMDVNRWGDRVYCERFCESPEVRKIISEYSRKFRRFVQPGGRHPSAEEVASMIRGNSIISGGCLFWSRYRVLGKCVSPDIKGSIEGKVVNQSE